MALYLNDADARGGPSGGGGNHLRSLVESCTHSDDITPLMRLVFEAQALGESPEAIRGAGPKRHYALLLVSCHHVCNINRAAPEHTLSQVQVLHNSNPTAPPPSAQLMNNVW